MFEMYIPCPNSIHAMHELLFTGVFLFLFLSSFPCNLSFNPVFLMYQLFHGCRHWIILTQQLFLRSIMHCSQLLQYWPVQLCSRLVLFRNKVILWVEGDILWFDFLFFFIMLPLLFIF